MSLVQFHPIYGLRVGQEIAIVQTEMKLVTKKIENQRLVDSTQNGELEKDDLAFVVGINELYQKKSFRPVSAQNCLSTYIKIDSD